MKDSKRNPGAAMNSQGPNMESLAESLILLGHRAVAEYKPVVDSILNRGSSDVANIEQVLDGLLGFCFDSQALGLYKRMCRHYLTIDPEAAAAYVHAYWDMWDAGQED